MLPLASPNPAVQSGGMRAVAMATPDITVPFSFLHISNIPAQPPNRAISTSYMVGFVRARSSVGLLRLRGVMRKYMNDDRNAIVIMMRRLLTAVFRSFASLIPSESPIPKIGPISGEISMAPIMTGIELTLSPMDAMIQAFGPLKYTFLRMDSSALAVSKYSDRLTVSLKNRPNF